ncbi:HNH endonuclease signature motif containing protein [Paeniglutamicibacter sp. Y32M11]|uniref:HNH endonuclease signature motif containing protein n=1 Tax=Paeniglutamicibacter sp. Y32M11 TaxID=2853258 RepID=UPI001C5283FC|nr:HNH endonuclease signature motif containing protein [Paeniglutamicibacter sp. Y32M11]QXQ10195.1 HNH endonuclease [Paeniglutamicibacter sp. Y32M11]
MNSSATPSASGRQARISTTVRNLAAVLLDARSTVEELTTLNPDAASSALILGLLENTQRTIAYGQLHATFHAEVNQIYRLDPETATHLDALAAAPQALADGTTAIPAERMCTGMAQHRNTAAYLQAHLHISASEARRRLTGARLLVAPAPSFGLAAPLPGPDMDFSSTEWTMGRTGTESTLAPPLFPVLAQAAADGTADVGNLAQLAGRLEGMQPRIHQREDASKLNTAIEESLAHEARTAEPRNAHKALSDWGAYLETNGAPMTDEEIRAKRGMFYRGVREGFAEYLLRCDPIDAESIESFGEAWSNPRSNKVPPVSASTAGPHTVDPPTVGPPTVGAGNCDGQATARKPVTRPVAPVGIPAPAWAIAPGMAPDQVPLSSWVDGVATSNGTDNTTNTNTNTGSGDMLGLVDPRTTPQLLLDGIIASINGSLTGTALSESGGLPVRVGVLIDYQSLLGQCETAGITGHGRVVSAENIRRLACDAGILPAVLGSQGEILDLGREVRGFSPAQRKALAMRDRGCCIPGCHRPASTTEAHHVKSWLDGGVTSVANGALTCGYHHLQIHAGLITLRMIDGIPYVVERAGQPRGDPERNLWWHPELRTVGFIPPLFTD